VDIVSGRPRETLEAWLGHLPIALWAEHGFWRRTAPTDGWRAAGCVVSDWMDRVRSILDHFTASTPGAYLECKTAGLAWHYRAADEEVGTRQAHELRMLLGDALSNQPFEVIEGKKVIEIRLRGVSKAVVAYQVQAEAHPDEIVIAIGDDRTDEDLFRALPSTSITIGVGSRPAGVRYHVNDHVEVRDLLRALASPASDPLTTGAVS